MCCSFVRWYVFTACLQKYVVSVSAGSTHSAAVDDKGQLYLWGDVTDGKLGVPTVMDDLYVLLYALCVFDGFIISVYAGVCRFPSPRRHCCPKCPVMLTRQTPPAPPEVSDRYLCARSHHHPPPHLDSHHT